MKDKKILIGVALALLLLLAIGLSYAYFSTSVKGNDSAKDIVVEAGTLSLVYTDGPEIKAEHIKPGWSTTKEVSVKNTGTLDANYNIIWQSLTNEITNDEIVISATCERLNASGTVEGTCDAVSQSSISDMTIAEKINIEAGVTHKYTFTILFKETNADQNYNQGKGFNGVLGIEEYKNTSSKPIYCTYDGELTQGAEYVNGQYTYRYMQDGDMIYSPDDEASWSDINDDGWGVILTDKTSTEVVTSNLCTYINNKPVVSMSAMFAQSEAVSIDFSNFNTSNVTDMYGMFSYAKMNELNLSNFDTSNVTDMGYMFEYCEANIISLNGFDTNKVTDMRFMFSDSFASVINGLDSFNTGSVTNMSAMFYHSQATLLDLNSFNTSNVTDMGGMFTSSFDLEKIYVSNKFNTDKVTDSENMFIECPSLVGGAGTKYDSTKTDKTYAHIDGGTSNPGYFTDIADKK